MILRRCPFFLMEIFQTEVWTFQGQFNCTLQFFLTTPTDHALRLNLVHIFSELKERGMNCICRIGLGPLSSSLWCPLLLVQSVRVGRKLKEYLDYNQEKLDRSTWGRHWIECLNTSLSQSPESDCKTTALYTLAAWDEATWCFFIVIAVAHCSI